MDNVISEFLALRKANWLKKKTTHNMTNEEVFAVEQEAEVSFLLENWLPDAAKRARQLCCVSHPGKFSHPDSKISPIVATSSRSEDGFLRTGNVQYELDILGNAAAMDVFKFLSLKLSDDQTILEHLEINSEKIKEDLTIASMSFNEIKSNFLAIKHTQDATVTCDKVKQVYFPVGENYHLLSILTPSGLIFELKNRINKMRFSEDTKSAKADKKENIHNNIGYDDLYNLSMIGYGGTKPQNISVLNSKNGGKAYLLPSHPPLLNKQYFRFPRNDFFSEVLWPKQVKSELYALHDIFKDIKNNIEIRHGRDEHLKSILDYIIHKMWLLRSQQQNWSAHYDELPIYQKIWLDDYRQHDRAESEDWLHDVVDESARWIIFAYKQILKNKAVPLFDPELMHVEKIIKENKEDLR